MPSPPHGSDNDPPARITTTSPALLRQAGPDGTDLAKDLRRLPPLKTKAEYDPDAIPHSAPSKAVERAHRCGAIARRVVASRP